MCVREREGDFYSKSRSTPGGTQSVGVIFKRAMGETERARDRMRERREVKMNVVN